MRKFVITLHIEIEQDWMPDPTQWKWNELLYPVTVTEANVQASTVSP